MTSSRAGDLDRAEAVALRDADRECRDRHEVDEQHAVRRTDDADSGVPREHRQHARHDRQIGDLDRDRRDDMPRGRMREPGHRRDNVIATIVAEPSVMLSAV